MGDESPEEPLSEAVIAGIHGCLLQGIWNLDQITAAALLRIYYFGSEIVRVCLSPKEIRQLENHVPSQHRVPAPPLGQPK